MRIPAFGTLNFSIYVLRGIEEALTDYDIELVQFSITGAASFSKFKRYLADYKVDGIICIEFLEPEYIAELLGIGVPLVFLDFPLCYSPLRGHYDIILPESQDAVTTFCLQLIREENCKTFGFVGDHKHCRSFYERFTGMTGALFFAGLPLELQYSILEDDSLPYEASQILEALKKLPAIPDCFICANDSIALHLMSALKSMKIHVPKDVKVVGFDNVPDAKYSNPPLTSFNVNKIALGKRIITILLDRISNPTQANQIIHIASKVIVRSST